MARADQYPYSFPTRVLSECHEDTNTSGKKPMRRFLGKNPTYTICLSNEKAQGKKVRNAQWILVKYFTGFDLVPVSAGVECVWL